MPVAMETTKAAAETVPTIPVKKVEKSRSKSRSRSRSRTRSRTRSRSRSLTSFSSRSSRLNMSHNLSLSDLMNRSFGPDKAELADDDVEVQYYFWGAELSCSSPSHAWRIFHPEDEAEDDLRHLLFLRQATLGVNAIKGERNIVEVTSKDYEGNVVRQILCSLTLGGGLDTVDLDLTLQYDHEVSFKLIKGSGPIHLVGNHYVETPAKEGEEEELETDGEDDEVEDLDDMAEEDEKDLKEGANEEYETEEDDKTPSKDAKPDAVEDMEN